MEKICPVFEIYCSISISHHLSLFRSSALFGLNTKRARRIPLIRCSRHSADSRFPIERLMRTSEWMNKEFWIFANLADFGSELTRANVSKVFAYPHGGAFTLLNDVLSGSWQTTHNQAQVCIRSKQNRSRKSPTVGQPMFLHLSADDSARTEKIKFR